MNQENLSIDQQIAQAESQAGISTESQAGTQGVSFQGAVNPHAVDPTPNPVQQQEQVAQPQPQTQPGAAQVQPQPQAQQQAQNNNNLFLNAQQGQPTIQPGQTGVQAGQPANNNAAFLGQQNPAPQPGQTPGQLPGTLGKPAPVPGTIPTLDMPPMEDIEAMARVYHMDPSAVRAQIHAVNDFARQNNMNQQQAASYLEQNPQMMQYAQRNSMMQLQQQDAQYQQMEQHFVSEIDGIMKQYNVGIEVMEDFVNKAQGMGINFNNPNLNIKDAFGYVYREQLGNVNAQQQMQQTQQQVQQTLRTADTSIAGQAYNPGATQQAQMTPDQLVEQADKMYGAQQPKNQSIMDFFNQK